MNSVSPILRLALLAVGCFSLATLFQPRALTWGSRAEADSLLKVFLGEGRRLFANHFFIQADVSFHSGYYPSIFEQANRPKTSAMAGNTDAKEAHDHDDHTNCSHAHDEPHDQESKAQSHAESEHEREMAFLKEPLDWIERFGRRFLITEHTHLEEGQEREILPWLRVSAELDPQRVETYTVAAYWLRTRLGKPREAETFLREGLRHNPTSYEILFELGRVYHTDFHEPDRARNVWELALRRWDEQESAKEKPNLPLLAQITENLALVEEQSGNLERAIALLERAKVASPHPGDLEAQIAELRTKLLAR